jgi:predicted dehydrogenase
MFMLRKPCSHNPAEGALLVEAQQKYGKLVQMGTQQRSSPHTIEAIEKIRAARSAGPYFAKAWYSQRSEVDWDRKRSTGAAAVGLGLVAGPRAAAAL